MLKIEKINTAIFEARRFISAAKKWQDWLSENYRDDSSVYYLAPSKEGGACKRASMDLTRALAELRKPD